MDKKSQDIVSDLEPGEPSFIIRGRDPDGAVIVGLWAARRRAAGDETQATTADVVADAITIFHEMGHISKSAPNPESYPASNLHPDVEKAITHAAETFEDYARQHLAKCTQEGNEKAARNKLEAKALRDLLGQS